MAGRSLFELTEEMLTLAAAMEAVEEARLAGEDCAEAEELRAAAVDLDATDPDFGVPGFDEVEVPEEARL